MINDAGATVALSSMMGRQVRQFLMIVTAVAASFAAEAASPDILSAADEERYRAVFELQEDARWSAADALIAKIEDPVLMGYVRKQRLLHPNGYRAGFQELKEWMAYYADHPDADSIYTLAVKRAPRGSAPQKPVGRKWLPALEAPIHPDLERDYAATSRPLLQQIEGRVRHLAKNEQASLALSEIDRRLKNGDITMRQYDRMRSWLAASLYYQGYVERARGMADEVSARNGDSAVLAYWISGLIAFRDGDVKKAHERFSRMASVPYQEDSLRAGAGFWAARTALADGHADDIAPNLEIAAKYPYTFYGQLALGQLGRGFDSDIPPPPLTDDGLARLVAIAPQTRRAIALAEIGRIDEADLEFRWINGMLDDEVALDLLALVAALDLPAAQLDVAQTRAGKAFEAGLYPLPHYAPANGFTADPALIYALMRQESKFKTEATSRVGAKGLMQLMPRTASYMANDRSLQNAAGSKKLYDPAVNLSIGQDYVNHLIDTTADGDLFDMAVAYNGGPGNLRRWKREVPVADQLLFIESIPNPESRDFVERVLTNYWVYRARMGQKPISRDLAAAGKTPLYDALGQIFEQAK
jgi:soluble lytic murein transglycosylase-like protein